MSKNFRCSVLASLRTDQLNSVLLDTFNTIYTDEIWGVYHPPLGEGYKKSTN